MTIDEAMDGKLDMVRRFAVDVKALREKSTGIHPIMQSGAVTWQPPVSGKQILELDYDTTMLGLAEVFAWDLRIMRMVKESAEKLPTDVPISKAWLYTPSGVWWFGRNNPLILLQSSTMDPTGGDQRRSCCAISFWEQYRHPDAICIWGYSYDHNEPTRGPVPVTNVVLAAGDTLDSMYKTWLDEQALQTEVLMEGVRKAVNHFAESQITPLDDVLGSPAALAQYAHQHGLISKVDYQRALTAMRKLAWIKSAKRLTSFFLAASLWIQQEILVYQPGPMVRSTRKRAERVKIIPKVNVVELRRRKYEAPPGTEGHKTVEWSCSWVVRGHWRNMDWCGKPPKWIDPYVKGDPEKPLKNTERVFAVRR